MKKILPVFALAMLTLTLSGCAHHPAPPPETSHVLQSIVLIGGVHVDETAWNEVVKNIDANFYAITNFGRIGRDTEDPASLKNIAVLACDATPSRSTVVAHSFGGAVVNEMIGICPEKIAKILYLTAVIPLKGELPFDKIPPSGKKEYGKAVVFKPPMIIPKAPKAFFAAVDSTVDLNSPLPILYPEWMSITQEKIDYDVKKMSAVPKVYFYTTKDVLLTMKAQKNYVARAMITDTDTLPTGHFPMISDPIELASLIVKWSAKK